MIKFFKKYIKLIVFLTCIALAFLIFGFEAAPKMYEVLLTKDGYIPQILHIKKGDTVKFRSNLNKPFWPASDLHPSHLLYSEFDPKQGIPAESEWTFKFEKRGVWHFHDHLDPTKRGTVIVGNLNIEALKKMRDLVSYALIRLVGKDIYIVQMINACPKETEFEVGKKCWEAAISNIDKYFGINGAFEFLEKENKANINFAGTCHYYAEYIGFLSYERFFNGELSQIYKNANICGYGYYHSFLQEWISHTRDLPTAKEYCMSITEKGGNLDDQKNCFFGLGIGLTFLNMKDFQKEDDVIINKSISSCLKLKLQDLKMYDTCVDGVLSGLSHLYFGDHGLKLIINSNNPFWVCDKLSESFKDRCYPILTEVVYINSNQNFDKTISFIFKNKNAEVQAISLETLGRAIYNRSYMKVLSESGYVQCRKLGKTLMIQSCLKGFFDRYFEVLRPDFERVENIYKPCDVDNMNFLEKKVCEMSFAGSINN